MLIMSDFDGTVADSFPLVTMYGLNSDEPNWDGFYRITPEAPPIKETIELLRCLKEADHNIVFMTSRPSSNRTIVEQWLEEHLWRPGRLELLMRKADDERPGSVIKAEWIRVLMPDLVIDDEPDAIVAAKNCGCAVLQVHGFRDEAATDRIPPKE